MRHPFSQPLLLLLLIASSLLLSAHSLAAEPDCAADARITETFDNGAQWDMCWESRIRENLVLSDVYYTPANGAALRVLSSARLSQLHVAYDDSDVTYNDVTQYGLGGGYLLTLTEADCPAGRLVTVQTRPALCIWRGAADAGYRTASRNSQTETLNLFAVSQVGAYAYILNWTFYADGAIEPSLGATGALQRSSNDTSLPFGRVLEGSPDTLWLSHTHNYYWRLDFDLGTEAHDDLFSEQLFSLRDDGLREQTTEVFNTEQARKIDPARQTVWTIHENAAEDSAAYRIEPIRSGHRFKRTDLEPYTEYDLFVTVANDCERFASQNARYNPDCLNHVLQYVDGQSIDGQDIVLWYRVSFHHVPRNEDQRNMHTHWDGFVMEPVNVLPGTNNLHGLINNPPELAPLTDRSSTVGDIINETISAVDRDGDSLVFLATGLPSGVEIDSRGVVKGKFVLAGSYNVSITVLDDQSETNASFVWQVSAAGNGGTSGGGKFGLFSVLILFAYVLAVCVHRRKLLFLR